MVLVSEIRNKLKNMGADFNGLLPFFSYAQINFIYQ